MNEKAGFFWSSSTTGLKILAVNHADTNRLQAEPGISMFINGGPDGRIRKKPPEY